MNSMLHEGPMLLFRNRPTLAPELLQDALGVGLPAYTEARLKWLRRAVTVTSLKELFDKPA